MDKRMTTSTLRRRLALISAIFILTCVSASARAGGGNGYHSSGGGHSYGGGGGGSSFHSFGGGSGGSGSFSLSELILLLIVVIAIYYGKKYLKGITESKGFQATLDPDLQAGMRQKPPENSESAVQLQKKLNEVFVGIQKAWDKGSMDPMRAVLSDGVYHRFQMQLEMNRLQGMRNRVENPTLLDARILSEDRFGKYLSIDFLIRGRVVDSDIRIDSGAVIRGGAATVFEEIWSFTRLADANVKGVLQTLSNCPKCAAPLSDAGGSRCGHCGAVLNSGAYDWVLAEITQAEEWAANDRQSLQRYYAQLPTVQGADSHVWLSPQELEDRASVVFIRYHNALHQGNLGLLNMFAEPELLKALSGPSREPKQYQLAVGAVDLQGFAESDGHVKAWIRVKYSGTPDPKSEGTYQERVMVFRKALGAGAGQGNLSSLTCPNCGGPIETSDQAKCVYCENVLSSPEANWVLCEFGGSSLLTQLAMTRPSSAPLTADLAGANGAQALMPLIQAAATAIAAGGKNAVGMQMRMLAAIIAAALEDRVITEAEEKTIREFARHFGLGAIMVDMMLRKAKENPEALSRGENLDMQEALRWLNNFVYVAASDGRISPEEEALLTSFARRHNIEEKKVRFAIQSSRRS